MIPSKLKKGDEVRVIAPARSLKLISEESRKIAIERFEKLGLKVTFGKNTIDENFDRFASTNVENRLQDLHEAFLDKNVKAIFTVIGGYNSNQLLKYIDFDIIKNNPKIFCGFSDITALLDSIYAKTGLVTYSGPHFSSFGMKYGFEYTLANFEKMLMGNGINEVEPSDQWSDDLWFLDQEKREFMKNDGYWIINEGCAEGKIIGGNLATFSLLSGSEFRPVFSNPTILFIEDTEATNILGFDSELQALINQPDFTNVKGIVIGRFQKGSKVSKEDIAAMIAAKKELKNIPILANVDFGHSTPILTIPIGGNAKLNNDKLVLVG